MQIGGQLVFAKIEEQEHYAVPGTPHPADPDIYGRPLLDLVGWQKDF